MEKVILLTADALRYDAVVNPNIPTPHIDRLRKNSVEFTRAFSNGCGTPQVFPAILYSCQENTIGNAPKSKSIGEFFQEIGFETVGITTNPHTSSYYGYDAGFDKFYDYLAPTESKERKSFLFRIGRRLANKFSILYDFLTSYRAKYRPPYKRAEILNETAMSEMVPGKKQFFWIHYMDTHAPYSPPAEYAKDCEVAFKKRGKLVNKLYREDLTSAEETELRKLYNAELRYLDSEIGRLLSYLESLEENIYLVFTSDHGEAFGERGQYQHAHFFEFNIHVPLLFNFPENNGEVKKELASHLDIVPTLLHEFGVTGEFGGINLFQEERSHLVIDVGFATTVLTENWKLIEWDKEKYLFDISNDLEEEENLYAERPEIVQELNSLTSDISKLDI